MSVYGKIILAAIFIITLNGCGSYSSVNQTDDGTYLLLIGEPQSGLLTIDGGEPLALGSDTKSFNLNGQTVTKIAIRPGTHNILLQSNGQTTINRKFFVSEGNSFEVKLK